MAEIKLNVIATKYAEDVAEALDVVKKAVANLQEIVNKGDGIEIITVEDDAQKTK